MPTLRHRAEYAAFRAAVAAAGAVPASWSARAADAAAGGLMRLPRKWTRGDVARENLRAAYPERSDAEHDATVRAMWVHLFRVVAEMAQIPRKLRRGNQADVLSFVNRDETVRAMCTGRPVLLLAGHFGNWEVAPAAFGAFGVPVSVVAREMDNPLIHAWFAESRQRSGGRLISKKGGGGEITDTLAAGGAVALLGDQDAGSRGLFVPFFGRDASTFKSIALLAVEHDALVVVGYARRLPDDFREHRWVRFEVGTEAILDPRDYDGTDMLRALTADYTAALERAVRRSPEQYFWVHRRWKSVPRVRKKKRAKPVEDAPPALKPAPA